MNASLFADFDQAAVAAIVAERERELQAEGAARAARTAQRRQMRHAKGEASLAELLPARLADGESWHVISHGDIDALSYLAHALAGVPHFDYVAISTCCIAKADLDQIANWLDTGRIDRFELYAGEIFPNQYGDEYEQMLRMASTYDCRVVIAKNHSKITLASLDTEDYYLAIESSANVNTNPRIEQTAMHRSRELFQFYREFFRDLRSIDRTRKGA